MPLINVRAPVSLRLRGKGSGRSKGSQPQLHEPGRSGIEAHTLVQPGRVLIRVELDPAHSVVSGPGEHLVQQETSDTGVAGGTVNKEQ